MTSQSIMSLLSLSSCPQVLNMLSNTSLPASLGTDYAGVSLTNTLTPSSGLSNSGTPTTTPSNSASNNNLDNASHTPGGNNSSSWISSHPNGGHHMNTNHKISPGSASSGHWGSHGTNGGSPVSAMSCAMNNMLGGDSGGLQSMGATAHMAQGGGDPFGFVTAAANDLTKSSLYYASQFGSGIRGLTL